jgi:hypothetical protein
MVIVLVSIPVAEFYMIASARQSHGLSLRRAHRGVVQTSARLRQICV